MPSGDFPCVEVSMRVTSDTPVIDLDHNLHMIQNDPKSMAKVTPKAAILRLQARDARKV